MDSVLSFRDIIEGEGIHIFKAEHLLTEQQTFVSLKLMFLAGGFFCLESPLYSMGSGSPCFTLLAGSAFSFPDCSLVVGIGTGLSPTE